MKHSQLPRVVRRLVGLTRFTRLALGATAASVFLLDAEDGSLRGLVSEWDWTRTSFSTTLDDWPNVARAFADGEVRVISSSEAAGVEVGWFESRGITSTICVPLRHRGKAYGVLFFDFVEARTLGRVERVFIADIGRRCARALARAADGALSQVDAAILH